MPEVMFLEAKLGKCKVSQSHVGIKLISKRDYPSSNVDGPH